MGKAVSYVSRWLRAARHFVFVVEDATERNQAEQMLREAAPRKAEVLGLLARRSSNMDIARTTNFGVGTAKIGIKHTIDTLGVANRVGAVILAVGIGLVSKGKSVLPVEPQQDRER